MAEIVPGIADRSLAFWAKCAKCGWCWAAAYYPATVTQVATIAKRARCPKCNGKALVAKQAAGLLLEPQADA